MRHHLFLLKELVKRDFQGRYAGSALGLVWSFLQPLWMLLLFTFVFSTVMKISLAGARTGHFAIFLFCGLLPWMALQEGVMRASTADHRQLQPGQEAALPGGDPGAGGGAGGPAARGDRGR